MQIIKTESSIVVENKGYVINIWNKHNHKMNDATRDFGIDRKPF